MPIDASVAIIKESSDAWSGSEKDFVAKVRCCEKSASLAMIFDSTYQSKSSVKSRKTETQRLYTLVSFYGILTLKG